MLTTLESTKLTRITNHFFYFICHLVRFCVSVLASGGTSWHEIILKEIFHMLQLIEIFMERSSNGQKDYKVRDDACQIRGYAKLAWVSQRCTSPTSCAASVWIHEGKSHSFILLQGALVCETALHRAHMALLLAVGNWRLIHVPWFPVNG